MDVFTMEVRLCDDNGMVSDERVEPGSPGTAFDPDLTYRKLLNNLRARNGNHDTRKPYDGAPFPCTGSAHVAGEHVRCTSPAHSRPVPVPGIWNLATTAHVSTTSAIPFPVESAMLAEHERVINMRAALAGYDAQYGERSIGEQHPELPSGCVERVESVVNALRAELAHEQQAQRFRLGWPDAS